MDIYFRDNKTFWGFSLTREGILKRDITKYHAGLVKKIIDSSFEMGWELHWLPSVSCIFIKMTTEIWHYLKSKDEAEEFLRNLVFSRHYPCCELY